MSEEWRIVPGYQYYEVSNFGRVRSVDREELRPHPRWKNPMMWRRRGRILKPIEHRGYLVVKLGAPNLAFGIHRVVAWAWLGPQEEGMVVNHKDGEKTRNFPDNLEYISNSENVHHAYDHGLMRVAGEQNGNVFLSDDEVREIRASDEPVLKLAERFSVSRQCIWRIRTGRVRTLQET